ncbi:MAG: hypothetical protein LBE67_02755 [Kocuria palustris]|nr:hypothetical protein [Kocuria palustris]
MFVGSSPILPQSRQDGGGVHRRRGPSSAVLDDPRGILFADHGPAGR